MDDASAEPEEGAGARRPPLAWRVARVVLVVAAILGALRLVHYLAREPLAAVLESIPAEAAWAPWAMLAVAVIGTCFLVPGSLLSIASGFTFGFEVGVLVAGVGTWLGALASFYLGRVTVRARVARYVESRPRLRRLADDVAEHGGLLVFLTRLSPLAPSTAMNYGFSVSPVRPGAFALGSVGLLPNVAMYTYLGSISHDALATPSLGFDDWLEWALAFVWIASSGALLGWLVRSLKRRSGESRPPATSEPTPPKGSK